jgi:transcriptional regulator with PAS, ATPase and Fis domain
MCGPDWVRDFDGAVTVCDQQGIILYMNEKSQKGFGGRLVGENALDCHPEPAKSKLAQMLITHATNTYTIEKMGVKKLIHQAPWFQNGEYAGFVELSIEIPFEMPHFIRTPNVVE